MRDVCLMIALLLGMEVAKADADEQREVWPSPDRRIIIKQPQFRGPILFVDATTQEVLRTVESGAKTLSVLWSADSTWVAIFQYFNPHQGGSTFDVYGIFERTVRTITMPKHWPEQYDHEWFFEPKKWLGGGRLLIEGEKSHTQPAGDTELNLYDLFTYIIQCQRDGSSHVVKKRFVKTEREQ